MPDPKSDTRIQLLIAIIGLVGVLGTAVVTSLDKIIPLFQHPATTTATAPAQQDAPKITSKIAPKTVSSSETGSSKGQSSSTPKPKPVATTSPSVAPAHHAPVHSGQFSIQLVTGTPLHFYDFDAPQEFTSRDNAADFFFKPNGTPDGSVSVSALGKAMMAPQSPGRQAWDVDRTSFQGPLTASVLQNTSIPCITGAGLFCAFSVQVDHGLLIIHYTTFKP